MEPTVPGIDSSQLEDLRAPRLRTPFDNQAYMKLHQSRRPAVTFADETSYRNVFEEKLNSTSDVQTSTAREALPEKSVKRRSSRFGLAGLFNKSKQAHLEERLDRVGELFEADIVEEGPMTKGILDDLAPEEINALPSVDSSPSPLRPKPSKPALRAKSSFKKESTTKTGTAWDPPPLFQAYPQAVKHGTLRAPCLSAEAILRLHKARHTFTNPNSEPKEKRLKRHTAAEVLSKGEWTHKIFILVTSGYFLQYAGDGNFDRLPEKIMPLTVETAAFVSDTIPGQPYVLQISQVSDDQGTLDKEVSKSMLKKLGLRSEMRRSTSAFLLVLETAEEMSSWLIAVRKEIHAAGGKEYRSDDSQTQQSHQPLHHWPSQRYLIKRDPKHFSEEIDQSTDTIGDAETQDNPHTEKTVASEVNAIPIPLASNRQSMATQSSMVSRSVSNTTSSINQIYLDRLKESPRESYGSGDVKTASTSPESSPRLSADKSRFVIPDTTHICTENRPSPTSNSKFAHYTSSNQKEEDTSHQRSLPATSPTSSVPQSERNGPRHRRTSSPAAPNFSVPTFSKRYSVANAAPGLPHISTKPRTPVTIQEPTDESEPGEREVVKREAPPMSEFRHLRMSGANPSRRLSNNNTDAFSTTPASSGDCDRPNSHEGGKRFSCRFSSLEYSRGVSPVQLAYQSPSPHPPPTAALLPIPTANLPHRTSLYPPPNAALPPIPTAGKRVSMIPSPSVALYTVTASKQSAQSSDAETLIRPSSACPERERPSKKPGLERSPAIVSQLTAQEKTSKQPSLKQNVDQQIVKSKSTNSLKLHRPASAHKGNDAKRSDDISVPSPSTGTKTAFEPEGFTPPLDDSPPKPTREPPPPPPQPGRVQGRRSVVRLGREPPPVYSPATSPQPRISVSSKAESYFDGPAPHPFIPPIRVSERKFRGSLDGPWNTLYDGPQRSFLDLSVG